MMEIARTRDVIRTGAISHNPPFAWFGVTMRYSLIFICTIWVLKAVVIEAFFVPSRSMVPTLKSTDYILVPKFSYGLHLPGLEDAIVEWRLPKQGDIVVFTRDDDPATMEDESEQSMVKRVIGLPGNTVEIVGTAVYIDGKKIFEPYAVWSPTVHEREHFGPRKIPEDHVFLLGDNRDASKDSRSWNNPFVNVKRIKGQAVMVYWSGLYPDRAGKML